MSQSSATPVRVAVAFAFVGDVVVVAVAAGAAGEVAVVRHAVEVAVAFAFVGDSVAVAVVAGAGGDVARCPQARCRCSPPGPRRRPNRLWAARRSRCPGVARSSTKRGRSSRSQGMGSGGVGVVVQVLAVRRDGQVVTGVDARASSNPGASHRSRRCRRRPHPSPPSSGSCRNSGSSSMLPSPG